MTLLGGFDLAFDCMGTARTLQNSLRWPRASGAVVLVGIKLHPHTLDLSPIWHQEVDLVGVHAHGVERWHGERRHTYAVVIDLLQQGHLAVEGYITHRFPLRRWKSAIKTAANKETGAIKVVFKYGDWPGSRGQ